jgi:nucleotide-binding universal stress UspA family protein
MERLTAAGRDYLETIGAQLPVVPMESVVRFGNPAEEILVEAEAFGADVIVLATGKPSWFKRVTGGGIGQWLLRKAPVPVLLVRAA